MMEWYEAYATMQNQMDLTRDIILNASSAAGCESTIEWSDIKINLNNFTQSSLTNLILEHNKDLSKDDINNQKKLEKFLKDKKIKVEKSWKIGRMLLEVFEETVESKLIDPTFVTEYPVEVSPLSRRNEDNPDFADRFELFIGGKEFANGFCELNDPDDQASRFEDQVAAKDSGDKEAMDFDQCDSYYTLVQSWTSTNVTAFQLALDACKQNLSPNDQSFVFRYIMTFMRTISIEREHQTQHPP